MFHLLYTIAPQQVGDACAMYGNCPAFAPKKEGRAASDSRSANSGVYTADEVRMYRTCYSDFKSQFKVAYDSPLVGYGLKGYVPVDGPGAIESARQCWGPIVHPQSSPN